MSGIVVGLDIGTNNIRTVIAEIDSERNIKVLGTSKMPSQGVRNGVIVNIEAAVSVIKQAISEAETLAGEEVTSVYTIIGGEQVESNNSHGTVAIDPTNRNRRLTVSNEAKKRAIDCATAISFPMDKKLIHIIPQEYLVDDISGYKNPVGVIGVRLDVNVHLVLANITAFDTINKSILRAGYNPKSVMLKTLAASYATIHREEMELGSILIDMGGGTTDVIVINKDAPVYTTSIAFGGNTVTNDIAIVKGIPFNVAEKIKLEKGCCWISGNEAEEEVIIPGIGGRPPEQTTRYELCEIIQPRLVEIMTMVRKAVIANSKLKKLSGSIVLTGGGALMPGIVELTQNIWGTTLVRLGVSAELGENYSEYREPDFATAVGLVMANVDNAQNDSDGRKEDRHRNSGGFFSKLKEIGGKFF